MGLSDIERRWRADAEQRWFMPWSVARTMLSLFVAGNVVVFGTLAVHRPSFRSFTSEDSTLEWLQFATFSVAAVLALVATARLFALRRPLLGSAYATFGTALVFIAGEEIAWGQRVLDIETPTDGLFTTNEQGEITFHNLAGVLDTTNLAMLAVALFGTIAPFVLLRRRLVPFWDWVTPPTFLAPLFLTMVVYRVSRLTVFRTSRLVVNRLGEWAETCLAFALLGFMAAALWRTTRLRSHAASGVNGGAAAPRAT